MRGFSSVAGLLLFLLLSRGLGGCAVADGLNITGGLMLEGLRVTHTIDEGPGNPFTADTFDMPLPLFTFDARYHGWELVAEGLPQVVTVQFGDEYTALGIATASVRRHIVGPLFVGLGTTITTQNTSYSDSALAESTAGAGVRYELGYDDGRLVVSAASTPRVDARVDQACTVPTSADIYPCNAATHVPETGSEFDALARYRIPITRRLDVLIGARYIIYVGNIYFATGNTNVDRNVGSPLGSLGLQYHFR